MEAVHGWVLSESWIASGVCTGWLGVAAERVTLAGVDFNVDGLATGPTKATVTSCEFPLPRITSIWLLAGGVIPPKHKVPCRSSHASNRVVPKIDGIWPVSIKPPTYSSLSRLIP